MDDVKLTTASDSATFALQSLKSRFTISGATGIMCLNARLGEILGAYRGPYDPQWPNKVWHAFRFPPGSPNW